MIIGEVVEFERPNLQGKWNPNPITPVDAGWAYLVQRVWSNGEICVQPRLIVLTDKGLAAILGRAFVIKGYPVEGLKKRDLVPLAGKYRLANLTKNSKNGAVFFVFEKVTE
jgi:hypothetical protein